MKKTLLTLSTLGVTLFANTPPLHVALDMYQNLSFISKTYALNQTGDIVTMVPSNLTLENIKNVISEACEITNSSLSDSIKVKDSLSDKQEGLTLEKDRLTYQINALEAKESLLKSLSLKNENEPSKIDQISSYLTATLVKNYQELDSLKKELQTVEEELKKSTRASRDYKELEISYTCNSQNSQLQVQYPLHNIAYTSFYDISASITNKSVSIEKNANLDYRGVENFDLIDFNLYSYAYNVNVAPQPFYPEYLGEAKKVLYKTMAVNNVAMRESSDLVQVAHEELATKSVYHIKGAILISGDKNLLHVDKEVTDASFTTAIDGYGTSKAYLQATITTKKDYEQGFAKYALNSNPIAARQLEGIKKGRETTLYFGEDEQVQVEKELIKTLDEKAFFGDKRISTQNWRFKIINKKPSSTEIRFIHRTPVSKDANIIVKTIAVPNFNTQDAEGKTVWNFTLEPNEGKSIIFGYEVSKSN